MDSLLVNLRKYRPRENSDPLENFVTESFAWLLRSKPECLVVFIELLEKKLGNSFDLTEQETAISTQENFNNVYPDMVIKYDDFALVFEHKVNSKLHHNQLKNYRDNAAKRFRDNYKLILITRSIGQHAQNPDVALCWYEIYQCFQNKFTEQEKEDNWALREILALFEKERLVPTKPITNSLLKSYLPVLKIDRQMESLVAEAKMEKWDIVEQGEFLHYAKQQCWGRIGIEFGVKDAQGERHWSPGLFCGFVVNGSDHGIKSLMKDEPITTFIIDFNDKAQETLGFKSKEKTHNFDLYTKLSADIKTLLLQADSKWDFVDTGHHETIKFNRWHPLMLVRSTDAFFEGATTADEQRVTFHYEFNKIINEVSQLESFQALCDVLK